MPDIGNAKDCFELPPSNFSIFTLINVTWRTYLISCTVRYCFLFRFVSSNLSCNLFLWYYDQLVLFDKEINANLYPHCFWEYSKRFHWRYLSKPVSGGHPVLSGHYRIPRGCPLNIGFTIWTLTHNFTFLWGRQDERKRTRGQLRGQNIALWKEQKERAWPS